MTMIMKKLILLTVMVLSMVLSAKAMLPGPPLLVECPKCGHEKRLMSLTSGNTFGARQWSDSYREAPMLPRLSEVQKCPDCHGYFLLSHAQQHYDNSEDAPFATDTGRLTYEEMKEALCLLDTDSLSSEDEINIRFEFLHRYNDAFRQDSYESVEENPTRNEADKKLHKENLKAFVRLFDENDKYYTPILAELYRESGDFDKCLKLLNNYKPESDYLKKFINTMRKKAKKKDDMVFLLE